VDVASSEDHIIWFEGGDQASDNVLDIAPPFRFTHSFAPPDAHIVFIGSFSVRKMTQFHWLDDAIHDHGGAEAGSQSQEEHLSSLITPQCLHGSVVDEFYRTSQCGFKVESDPPSPEVARFRNRLTTENHTRIANRYSLVFPAISSLKTPQTISLAVIEDPEANSPMICWPATRSLTWFPPMSMTMTCINTFQRLRPHCQILVHDSLGLLKDAAQMIRSAKALGINLVDILCS